MSEATARSCRRRSPLARLEVRTDDQQGLLRVASDGDSVWAAWTPPDGRIVVGRVLPPPVEIVWAGPESSERANGGHLVVCDGALFVDIGDLEDPEAAGSPTSPIGKVLRGYVSLDVTLWRLAPDDGATQGAHLVEEGTVPDTCRISVTRASDDVAITGTGAEIVLLRPGS